MTKEETTITITGIPPFDANFSAALLDDVLTNVDGEFTPEHVEAAKHVIDGFVIVRAMLGQLDGTAIDADTFVALLASASVQAAKR